MDARTDAFCNGCILLDLHFLSSLIPTERMEITDEKQALEDVLQEIETALASKDFLSGCSEPNLGDLAIYGALHSIEGLPAHDGILVHADRPLKDWYERTKTKVKGNHP